MQNIVGYVLVQKVVKSKIFPYSKARAYFPEEYFLKKSQMKKYSGKVIDALAWEFNSYRISLPKTKNIGVTAR